MPPPLFGRVLDASERTELLRRSTGNKVVPLHPHTYNQWIRYPEDPLFFAYSEQMARQQRLLNDQIRGEWNGGNSSAWEINSTSLAHIRNTPDILYTSSSYYNCTFSFRLPSPPRVGGSPFIAGIYSSAGAAFQVYRTNAISGVLTIDGTIQHAFTALLDDQIDIRVIKDELTIAINGVDRGFSHPITSTAEEGPYYAGVQSSTAEQNQRITKYSFLFTPFRWWLVSGRFLGNWSVGKTYATHISAVPGSVSWLVPQTIGLVSFKLSGQSPTLRVGLTTDPEIILGGGIDITAVGTLLYVNGTSVSTYTPGGTITIAFGNTGSFVVTQNGASVYTGIDMGLVPLYFYVYSSGAKEGITGFSFAEVPPVYWMVSPGNGSLADWTTTKTSVSIDPFTGGGLLTSSRPYRASNTYFAFNTNQAVANLGTYIGLTRFPLRVGPPNLSDSKELWYDPYSTRIALGSNVIADDITRPYFVDSRFEFQTTRDNATIRITTSLGDFITQRTVSYDGTGGVFQYAGINDSDTGYTYTNGIILCNGSPLTTGFADTKYGWKLLNGTISSYLYDYELTSSSAFGKPVFATQAIETVTSINEPYAQFDLAYVSANCNMQMNFVSPVDSRSYLGVELITDVCGNVVTKIVYPDGVSPPNRTIPPPGPTSCYMKLYSTSATVGFKSSDTILYEWNYAIGGQFSPPPPPPTVLAVNFGNGNGISNLIFNGADPPPKQPFWLSPTGELDNWDTSIIPDARLMTPAFGNNVIVSNLSLEYCYFEFNPLVNPNDSSSRIDVAVASTFDIFGGLGFATWFNIASDGQSNVTFTLSTTESGAPTLPPYTVSWGPTVGGFLEVSSGFVLGGVLSNYRVVNTFYLEISPTEKVLAYMNAYNAGEGLCNVIFNENAYRTQLLPTWTAVVGSLTNWIADKREAYLDKPVNSPETVATISSNVYPYAEFDLSLVPSLHITTGFASSITGSNVLWVTYDGNTNQPTIHYPGGSSNPTLAGIPTKCYMQISGTFMLVGFVGESGPNEYGFQVTNSDSMNFFVGEASTVHCGISNLIFNSDSSRNHITNGVWTANYGVTNIDGDWTFNNNLITANLQSYSEISTVRSYPPGTAFQIEDVNMVSSTNLVVGFFDSGQTTSPNIYIVPKSGQPFYDIYVGGQQISYSTNFQNSELYTGIGTNTLLGGAVLRTRLIDKFSRSVRVDYMEPYSGNNANFSITLYGTSSISASEVIGYNPFFNTICGWGDTYGWDVSSDGTAYDIGKLDPTTNNTLYNNILKPTDDCNILTIESPLNLDIVDPAYMVVGFATSAGPYSFTPGLYVTICLNNTTYQDRYWIHIFDQNGTPAGYTVALFGEKPALILTRAGVEVGAVDSTGAVVQTISLGNAYGVYDSAFIQSQQSGTYQYSINRQIAPLDPPMWYVDGIDNQDGTWNMDVRYVASGFQTFSGWTCTGGSITNGAVTIPLDSTGLSNSLAPYFIETESYPRIFTYTLTANYIDTYGTTSNVVSTYSITKPPPYPVPGATVTATSYPGNHEISVDGRPLELWYSSWFQGNTPTSHITIEDDQGSTPYDGSIGGFTYTSFVYPFSKVGTTVTFTVTLHTSDYYGAMYTPSVTVTGVVPA